MENWKRTVYICTFGVFLTSMGMSQVAPILPLYFHELGIATLQDTALWSGLSMGITYIMVAIVSPFWGKLADRKGRKLILLRASLGMTITNALCALVISPTQLVLCRMLQGLVSGFYAGSITLVASQTPKEHTGWALGIIASGSFGGSLLGPVIGGYIAGIFGIRSTFFIVAALLFSAFILTLFFVSEDNFKPVKEKSRQSLSYLYKNLEHSHLLITMAISSFIYAIAFMSLQPIITIYVEGIVPIGAEHLALLSGIVFSATGLAQMLSSSSLGRLIDRIGPHRVLLYSLLYVGLLTIPQAYATNVYHLTILRFFLGFGLGGLLPAINTFISNNCPRAYTGQVFSYNQSAQFFGYFLGSIGGAAYMTTFGFTSLFWVTGSLFLANAIWIYIQVIPHGDKNHIPISN